MRSILFVFTICLFFAPQSYSQDSSEYSEALLEMFKVSGSEEAYQTVIHEMLDLFKESFTDIDQDTWDELEREFSKTSISDLAEMVTPVYQKYMTIEDIQELTRFYKTPVGQKFAKNTPMIMKESMEIGQEWGRQIGEKISKKLETLEI